MIDGSARRGTGRPRSSARPAAGPTVEDILRVAGQLFAEGGYGAITMARVARGVGLRQPSLYYYFANRQELFAAFVSWSYVEGLELARRITAAGGSATDQLRHFVEGDIELICSLPYAVTDIHRVAVRDRDAFVSYWKDRHALERAVAAIIRAGRRAGEFRPVPTLRTAQLILLTDDAAQAWYLDQRHISARRLASEVAELTIGGLLIHEPPAL